MSSAPWLNPPQFLQNSSILNVYPFDNKFLLTSLIKTSVKPHFGLAIFVYRTNLMKFWHSDLNIRLTAILQFLTRGDLHVKSQILHPTFSINPVSDDTHVFTFFIHCLFSRKTLLWGLPKKRSLNMYQKYFLETWQFLDHLVIQM